MAVRKFIMDGHDVNERIGSYETPSLAHAAVAGDNDIVQMMLRQPELKVNEADLDGDTALMMGLNYLSSKTYQEFLKHPDIDVYVRNRYGKTVGSMVEGDTEEMILPSIKSMIRHYIKNHHSKETK